MDFVAIDFETATSKYTSVCSLGLCVVENGKIKERKEIFIKPVPFEFNEYNIKIHGITPKDVINKPTFDKYWDTLKPYFENKIIVAHNAMFDVGVLCAVLDSFGITYPTFDYLCTVKLSQLAYPELPKHKLNCLCDALGITFSHHHAYDDAYACARVLMRITEDYSLNTLDEIKECFEVESGRVYPNCKLSFKKKNTKRKSVRR